MTTTQEHSNGGLAHQSPTETGCGRAVKPSGSEHPTHVKASTIIEWRRQHDGAEFSGAFVREVPQYHCIILANLSDGHHLAVHRSNIVRVHGQCAECGLAIDSGYPHRAFKECCFSCSCWREIMAADVAGERPYAVAGGTHYTFDDDPNAVGWGNSGCPHVILFTDGRSAATRNLWTQGVIPAHFRSRLPDNATSVLEARVREHSHA